LLAKLAKAVAPHLHKVFICLRNSEATIVCAAINVTGIIATHGTGIAYLGYVRLIVLSGVSESMIQERVPILVNLLENREDGIRAASVTVLCTMAKIGLSALLVTTLSDQQSR
jgi:hypothetical protein